MTSLALIELGRPWRVKGWYRGGIHEVGHLEAVNAEAVFLARVGNPEAIEAEAGALDARVTAGSTSISAISDVAVRVDGVSVTPPRNA